MADVMTVDDFSRLLGETSQALGQTQALVAMLAMHARGEIRHRFEGRCPDVGEPWLRDQKCAVCRTLIVWDEIREGQAVPTPRADGDER
jgi:hypothetical protein